VFGADNISKTIQISEISAPLGPRHNLVGIFTEETNQHGHLQIRNGRLRGLPGRDHTIHRHRTVLRIY